MYTCVFAASIARVTFLFDLANGWRIFKRRENWRGHFSPSRNQIDWQKASFVSENRKDPHCSSSFPTLFFAKKEPQIGPFREFSSSSFPSCQCGGDYNLATNVKSIRRDFISPIFPNLVNYWIVKDFPKKRLRSNKSVVCRFYWKEAIGEITSAAAAALRVCLSVCPSVRPSLSAWNGGTRSSIFPL